MREKYAVIKWTEVLGKTAKELGTDVTLSPRNKVQSENMRHERDEVPLH
jgi:hypothetical protein